MHRSLRVALTASALAGTLSLESAEARSRFEYVVTDLGPLDPLGTSQGLALADGGMAAGVSSSGDGPRATVWHDGTPRNLGVLSGPAGWSRATGVNAGGDAVGVSTMGGTTTRAFLATAGGSMVDLGTLEGGSWSAATAIGPSGIVVGYGDRGMLGVRAFRGGSGGSLIDLGVPVGGTSSWAHDVNSAGQIVGSYAHWSGLRSFVYMEGAGFVDIGSIAGAIEGRAINEDGWVTGEATDAGGRATAFLWRGAGRPVALGVPSGSMSSTGRDLNDLGQVVGRLARSDGTSSGFLWSESGGMIDLNRSIDPASGWTLTDAAGINNDGQIVGTGLVGGRQHAFLLTLAAVPEPSSLLLAALGASAVAGLAWSTRRRE